jgi:GT2 family glycosyltransferase
MDAFPRVAVVTVNYNHAVYLDAYIESLCHSQYPIAEIVIADNGSTDDSLDILRRHQDVIVIRNDSNVGYSAALNQVIERASCPLVCATGPDVIVEPDWLQPLVDQYLRDPAQTFAVVSRVLTLDRSEIQSAGSSLHFTGHLNAFEMWSPARTMTEKELLPRPVGAIDSTSVLFDRARFLAIGGCDTDFFVYHEEFDYCYRARMRGWRCWHRPDSVAYHGSGTAKFSVRSQGDYPRLRPYLHTRNRLLSILKDYQTRTLVGILPVLIIVEVFYLVLLMRLGLQPAYFDALRWLW